MAFIVVTSCSGFAFYYQQQEKKINKIAIASIKADERLEVRIAKAEARQLEVEKQQAAMGARITEAGACLAVDRISCTPSKP